MGHWGRTIIFLERKALSHSNHTMSIDDLLATDVKTSRLNSRCYLEKEFNELIVHIPK